MMPRQPENLPGANSPPEFPGQIRWSQIAASFLSIPGERRFGLGTSSHPSRGESAGCGT